PDFIFRAPIKLSKPGELREEYESQLRKLREEKLQEEKTSEELIHRLLLDDTEGGKRKMDEQQKKEESLVLKVNQECFPERLSDSENEEPFPGKQGHRSAFVSKSGTYSFTFLAGSAACEAERSRSCNDSLRERPRSRQRSAPGNKVKVPPAGSASTPLLGVLWCAQNHRCVSAPDLSAERRLALGAAASSAAALHRPERSVSPESNDSISEELNHFKPIVCSPCTPPKRLPDGRVLSPLIIKSTPRNLSRSLQKPTTYEASPRILKKWEQIFQERQIKRTLSKATLTSSASEPGDEAPAPDAPNAGHCGQERPLARDEPVPVDPTAEPRLELDFLPSRSERKPGRAGMKSSASRALVAHDGSTGADAGARGASVAARTWEAPDGRASGYTDKPCPGAGSHAPSRRATGADAAGRRQLEVLQAGEPLRVPNSSCGERPPSLRRGRKRRCKTKHLEAKGSAKRPRAAAGAARRQQQEEEEDRRLALRLQRGLDSESRTVDGRRDGGPRYLLRSKGALGAK
ncbi:RN169 ligase, partial [Eudromia elegans]|nr:RN169 ligase [Eudromia elegans]